jgi:hypothetical protein
VSGLVNFSRLFIGINVALMLFFIATKDIEQNKMVLPEKVVVDSGVNKNKKKNKR